MLRMLPFSCTPQARSEATLYHDPLGSTTSTLSADLQTSGGGGMGGGGMDALCTLRADVRRRGVLGSGGRATLGLVATRLAGGRRRVQGCGVAGGRRRRRGHVALLLELLWPDTVLLC